MTWAGLRILVALAVLAAAPNLAARPAPAQNKAPALDARGGQAASAGALLSCLFALSNGQFAQGEKACSKAIALDPKNSEAWRLRGYGYLLDQRFERANADLRKALDLGLKDGATWAGYGRSFSGEGRFSEALGPLRKAVALEPRNVAYWNALCWAEGGNGKALTTALSHCNRAIALDAAMAGPWNSRGLVQLRLGRYKAAVSDYTEALKRNANQPSAAFGRGVAWLRLGQKVSALADLSNARNLDGDIDKLFVTLGVVPAACLTAAAKDCPPATETHPQTAKPPALVVRFRQSDQDDQFLLGLEAGRFDLMLDQIALILGQPDEVMAETDLPRDHGETVKRLTQSLVRFNRLLPGACAARRIDPGHCRPLPVSAPPLGRLGQAYDAAYRQLYPVWQAMCRGHEETCQIE